MFRNETRMLASIFRRISRMQSSRPSFAPRFCGFKSIFRSNQSERFRLVRAFPHRFRLIPTANLPERLSEFCRLLNTQSRTLKVEAEIENIDGLLKPGQFATVRITQSKPEPAVMIPASAVRADGERNLFLLSKTASLTNE